MKKKRERELNILIDVREKETERASVTYGRRGSRIQEGETVGLQTQIMTLESLGLA